jgi:hypothetical protein
VTRPARLAFALVALVPGGAGTGCSIFSKTELPPPRYFRPGAAPAEGAPAAPPSPGAPAQPLRVRDVAAASHLRERLVWTTPAPSAGGGAAEEYGFYDDRLWTEPPAELVAAALGRALFEEGGFTRTTAARAPVLDVRVVEFEEVVTADRHVGRVGLHVLLTSDAGEALLERTFVATSPAGPDPASKAPGAVAVAIGAALDEVVGEVAGAVRAALAPR